MSKFQTILVIVGILGAYASVSDPIPTPDDPIVIPIPDTPYPSAPTKSSVLPLAKQVTILLASNPQDALIIAGTFQDWAKFLVEDQDIKNTLEFREVFLNATKTFFSHTDMTGKYSGLDSIISNIIIESLRNADPLLSSGKENVQLNFTIREAYKDAMNAVSWGAYEVVNQTN